ncbi:Helix-turn-helix protein [Corynebacterium uterequi]|uniref:Helix-turn-helix protein n=1 Tax=Corynebacterium uterequi TaxID=1072256 RepID=A0A0G3HET8_9CORY|nr:Helix-turn-helix protein [Corynebacterium uterequi]
MRDTRVMRGISQQRLARLAGLSRNALGQLESPDGPSPRVSTLYKVAFALDVPPMVILPAVGLPVFGQCPVERPPYAVSWPCSPADVEPFDASLKWGLHPDD